MHPSAASARARLVAVLALVVGLLSIAQPAVAAGSISLTTLNVAYTQDFDTLASSGTSSTVPTGWDFSESGTNANTTYTAGTGSSNTGDTYSFGAASATERAFGGLLSNALVPLKGAQFTNDTTQLITGLTIAYTGEQWRLGALGRLDRLDFQLSTDATSLTTGTWTDHDDLDFAAPIQGPTIGSLDGNAAANRAAVSSTIAGINVPAGTSFWIRWVDLNPSGADDGLAVDDFSLTPRNLSLACSSDIVQGNDPGAPGAVVTYPDPVPYGGTGTYITLTSTPASGSSFPIGTTTVTGFVEDDRGRSATCTFTVTVVDVEPPTIVCPANITATATSPAGAVVTFAPVANDNAPGVTVGSVPPSGSLFPLGTTTVTATATDGAGNTATCSFTVTVRQAVAPPDPILTVAKVGAGTGTVTSAPAGIACPPDCREAYPPGTVVTLTPHPGAGSTFREWGGACTGAALCRFAMRANINPVVTAIFDPSEEPPPGPSADLSVAGSASAEAQVGSPLTFTFEVANAGPDAATAVSLAGDVSGAFATVAAVAGGDTASATQDACTLTGSGFTCALGDLGPGAGATVTVSVIPYRGGALTASATATSVVADPNAGNDTAHVDASVRVVCTLTGTLSDDVLTGTAAIDVICAKGGDDTVSALGGNDIVLGGPGVDTIGGGEGDDLLKGGPAADALKGGPGVDVCEGGGGVNTFTACEP